MPPPPPPSPPHSSSTATAAANAGALVPWVPPDEPVAANGGKKKKKKPKKPAAAAGRSWSESDELRILEALAAYAGSHGAAPSRSNLRAALAGCRLDKAEFTVTEIYEKVRRLRLRYANPLRSAAGTVPIPAAAGGDEARKYELSMAIWGDEPLNNSTTKARATNADGDCNSDSDSDADADADAAPRARVRREVEELQELYPSLALAVDGITDDELLRPHYKRAFQFIGDEEARELDARVKKQMVREAKMTAGRAALKNQVLGMLIGSTD